MNDTTITPPRPAPPLAPLLSINEDDDYDAWVLAGGRLFRAHASVLASHSAYLRGAAVGGVTGARGDVRLLLPHVPPAGFAAILTYMYTGRLPVTPATLYEVLLAGHLLQMTGVVSLCQALLTTTTTTTPTTAGEGSAGLGVTPDLPSLPPALSVWRGLARLVPPPPHHPHQHPGASSPSSSLTLPATIVRPTPTRARPLHPPLELTREPEAMETEASESEEKNTSASFHHHPVISTSTTPLQQPTPQHFHHNFREMGHREDKAATVVGRAGAVVLDVATCDGPVFFERVINRAYKANPLLGPEDSETETEINVEEVDSSEDTSNRPPHATDDKSRDGLSNLLRISSTSSLKGESKALTQPSQRSSSPPIPNNTLSRTYHCVYCNHTFKSHYCYQKHMRRHINPITVEVDKPRPSTTSTTNTSTSPTSHNDNTALTGEGNSSVGTAGGEGGGGNSGGGNSSSGGGGSGSGSGSGGGGGVAGGGSTKSGSTSPYSSQTVSPAPSSEGLKILDLNVQYFPCKTCGSKFPSYYFVHKHRRLCHQDEENAATAAAYGKKSAPTPSTPPSSTASTPTPRLPTPAPVVPPPPLDAIASPATTTTTTTTTPA